MPTHKGVSSARQPLVYALTQSSAQRVTCPHRGSWGMDVRPVLFHAGLSQDVAGVPGWGHWAGQPSKWAPKFWG